MCGIAGIISLAQELRPPLPWLEIMAERIAHRGPDGSGFAIEGNCGFAHRRLSILDLSETGAQPMRSHDGRVLITYNGELYNEPELRRELISLGVEFNGTSDTEVLVEMLARFGWDTLPKLSGMFAFAAWFVDRNELLLARDGAGIKPLFYAAQQPWFLFGSEIPALLVTGLVPPDINEDALSQYVRHAQPVMGERTMWKYIRSVPPGGWVRLSADKELTTGYFWRSPVQDDPETRLHETLAAERVQQLLQAQVAAEMRADVPVGAYLSGGVDSSILVYELSKCAPGKVRTFGIGFSEAGFNESQYARMAARTCGVQHTQLEYNIESYLTDWVKLVQQRGMPLTVPNEPPLLALARAASSEVKVVLTGEGSDELFGGYPLVMRAPFDYYRSQLLSDRPEVFGNAAGPLGEAIEHMYGRRTFRSPLDHFLRAYRWIPVPLSGVLFGVERASALEREPFLENFWQEQFTRLNGISYAEQVSHLLWNVHLPGLLGRIDSTTMAASIEGRVPFVGKPVVEYGITLPYHYKIRFLTPGHEEQAFQMPLETFAPTHDMPKYILRSAYRNKLPDSLRLRRKSSFPVPLDAWLQGPLRNSVRDRLMACAEQSHWFDRDGIEYLFAAGIPSGSGIAIWMAVNLALFYEARQAAVSAARGAA